jgi:hypothetical protein
MTMPYGKQCGIVSQVEQKVCRKTSAIVVRSRTNTIQDCTPHQSIVELVSMQQASRLCSCRRLYVSSHTMQLYRLQLSLPLLK